MDGSAPVSAWNLAGEAPERELSLDRLTHGLGQRRVGADRRTTPCGGINIRGEELRRERPVARRVHHDTQLPSLRRHEQRRHEPERRSRYIHASPSQVRHSIAMGTAPSDESSAIAVGSMAGASTRDGGEAIQPLLQTAQLRR